MRLVRQGVLCEMYFTGEPLDVQEAYRVGLVDRVFPSGRELEAARALADKIATKSQIALRFGKEAPNGCEALDVDSAYELEQQFAGGSVEPTTRWRQRTLPREAPASLGHARSPALSDRPYLMREYRLAA